MTYEMSCYGFPVGDGASMPGRITPTSQNVSLGGLGMLVQSGQYMGALGRSSLDVRGLGSARSIDMTALGAVSASASAEAKGSGDTWGTVLQFFQTAVEGAPAIIAAARDQSSTTAAPATSTGPGVAYYTTELDRMRRQQEELQTAVLRQQQQPQSLIPGVSNAALLLGGGALVVASVLAVALLKK